jgi:hypothetical protein
MTIPATIGRCKKAEREEIIMARKAGRISSRSGAYRDRTGDLRLAKPRNPAASCRAVPVKRL